MGLISLVLLYGFVAVFFIIKNRLSAKRAVQRLIQEQNSPALLHPKLTPQYMNKVASGTTGPQMSSFVLSIILTLLPFATAATAVSFFDDYFFYYGYALIALTPVTIIVNAFWIYPRPIVLAEEYVLAVGERTKMVRLQRTLAWIIWVGYLLLAVACVTLLTTILGFSFT